MANNKFDLADDLGDLDDFEPKKNQFRPTSGAQGKPPRPPSTQKKGVTVSKNIRKMDDDDLEDLEDMMVNNSQSVMNKKSRVADDLDIDLDDLEDSLNKMQNHSNNTKE